MLIFNLFSPSHFFCASVFNLLASLGIFLLLLGFFLLPILIMFNDHFPWLMKTRDRLSSMTD